MPMPNAQPVLPAEGVPTNLEEYFTNNQPPRLFPTNQNSNFGTIRKVITDEIQIGADDLSGLFNELFVSTASGYLGLWEDQMGLPKAAAGRTTAQRRVFIGNRLRISPFTRTRRRELVESFITATFGGAMEFTPGGVPLDGAGIPLFSEYASVSTLYTITEDSAFHYIVNIVPTVDPDIVGLTRELTWMTPGGITFSITRNP